MTIGEWYSKIMTNSVALAYAAAVANINNHERALSLLADSNRKIHQAEMLRVRYWPKNWNTKVHQNELINRLFARWRAV